MPDSTDLMEIPVREKGYRKKSSSSASGTSSASTHATISPSNVSEPSSEQLSKNLEPPSRRRAVASSKLLGSVSSLSPLERLPTELLEIIFLQCLNLSLPRASLWIAKSLASTHVKTQLYFVAFSGMPYKDVPGAKNTMEWQLTSALHLIEIFNTHDAIARFQSDILAMKWMTPDFLQQFMAKLMIYKTV